MERERNDVGLARDLTLSCCRVRCPQRRKRAAGDTDTTAAQALASRAAARGFRGE